MVHITRGRDALGIAPGATRRNAGRAPWPGASVAVAFVLAGSAAILAVAGVSARETNDLHGAPPVAPFDGSSPEQAAQPAGVAAAAAAGQSADSSAVAGVWTAGMESGSFEVIVLPDFLVPAGG
ncbi:MAG: hypothetical protein ACKOWF_12740 [Chloroflexota bacterium]